MQLKIIRMMETRFIGCFMTRLKEEIIEAREANVHRFTEVSGNIIDQCVASRSSFC